VSAKYGQGVSAVHEWVLSHMPLGPAYYPKVSQEQRLLRGALQQRLAANSDQLCMSATGKLGPRRRRVAVQLASIGLASRSSDGRILGGVG
jgi:hypothetical protein